MNIILNKYNRYRTLSTHRIHNLPIAILMPHSACNCLCVMCDIWKDNKNLKQLNEADLEGLMHSLKKLGTKLVVMSGGEALLNPKFFTLCEILKKEKIRICLLSTGLGILANSEKIIHYTNEVIVSLDGDRDTHNRIRNIPLAYEKMKTGVDELKRLNPSFRVTGRSVIHRLNYTVWPEIIATAKELRLDQISFLPADISSHAFNREVLWTEPRKNEIRLSRDELPLLKKTLETVIKQYKREFDTGFIAESPEKLGKIHQYYSAFYGINPFPYKKCNAPWVSVVIEADGAVRPCFFHEKMGNIHNKALEEILNSQESVYFRKGLDIQKNETCLKCVCYLNLSPGAVV